MPLRLKATEWQPTAVRILGSRSMELTMELTSERDGMTLMLKVDGELKDLQDKKLKSILKDFGMSERRWVALDFKEVKSCSSAGIDKLYEIYKAAGKNHRLIEIAAINYNLRETYKLTKLNLLMPLSGTRELNTTMAAGSPATGRGT